MLFLLFCGCFLAFSGLRWYFEGFIFIALVFEHFSIESLVFQGFFLGSVFGGLVFAFELNCQCLFGFS